MPSKIRRNWTEAREKVEREGHCRVCGAPEEMAKIDAAHVIGTSNDAFDLDGTPRPSKCYKVEPVRIVPLCGPHPAGCHGDYDAHRLDLLALLTKEEQAQAVLDAGSIESARRRLCPSEYRGSHAA